MDQPCHALLLQVLLFLSRYPVEVIIVFVMPTMAWIVVMQMAYIRKLEKSLDDK